MRQRRRIPSFAVPAPDVPISALNTTPLIDVMLVLLIMFIITIPLTTHKVPLQLPGEGPGPVTERVVHRLDLDAAGRISLDGRALGQAQLAAALAPIAADPAADLLLRTHGETRYEPFDEVMAIVQRAGITRLGMVDNEKFAAELD